MNTDIRKLVTIRKINDVVPIPNADFIEQAIIGGWSVVIKKDEFKAGDKVLYFEIDSFLPTNVPQFSFYEKFGTKKFNDVIGHKVKTIKLKGIYSQGLIMDINKFPDLINSDVILTDEFVNDYFINQLGVMKWEYTIPVGSNAIGPYPGFTIKTDSERYQNLSDELLLELSNLTWIPSEKLDGMSTIYFKYPNDNTLRVASRNFEVELAGHYKNVAEKYNLDKLINPGEVVKGELVGPKIQSNTLKLHEVDFYVFETDVKYLPGVKTVPIYDFSFPTTLSEAGSQVEGLKSLVNTSVMAEGIVWWNKEKINIPELGYRPNFKAINNKFLLNEK